MGGEREPQHTCQACSGGSVNSAFHTFVVTAPIRSTPRACLSYDTTVSQCPGPQCPGRQTADTHPPHHSQCWHCPPPPPLRCQSRAGSRARPAPPFASAQPIERCPLRREQPEQRREVVGRSATAQQHSFSSGGAANEPAAGVTSDGGVAASSGVEGHAPVGGAASLKPQRGALANKGGPHAAARSMRRVVAACSSLAAPTRDSRRSEETLARPSMRVSIRSLSSGDESRGRRESRSDRDSRSRLSPDGSGKCCGMM